MQELQVLRVPARPSEWLLVLKQEEGKGKGKGWHKCRILSSTA